MPTGLTHLPLSHTARLPLIMFLRGYNKGTTCKAVYGKDKIQYLFCICLTQIFFLSIVTVTVVVHKKKVEDSINPLCLTIKQIIFVMYAMKDGNDMLITALTCNVYPSTMRSLRVGLEALLENGRGFQRYVIFINSQIF